MTNLSLSDIFWCISLGLLSVPNICYLPIALWGSRSWTLEFQIFERIRLLLHLTRKVSVHYWCLFWDSFLPNTPNFRGSLGSPASFRSCFLPSFFGLIRSPERDCGWGSRVDAPLPKKLSRSVSGIRPIKPYVWLPLIKPIDRLNFWVSFVAAQWNPLMFSLRELTFHLW